MYDFGFLADPDLGSFEEETGSLRKSRSLPFCSSIRFFLGTIGNRQRVPVAFALLR